MDTTNPIRTILLVDNSPAIVSFLEAVLSERGYEVRTAATGMQALRSMREVVPDLAIVDRIMPEIDGDELCRLIRSDARTQSMFVIMLSAVATEDPAPPMISSVDAYLAKTRFGELKQTVLKVISDFEAGKTDEYANRVVGVEPLYRREITTELLESKRHLETLLETTPDGVLELNEEHIVVRANERAGQLLGMKKATLVSSDFRSILSGAVSDSALGDFLAGAGFEYRSIGNDKPIAVNDRFLELTARSLQVPQRPAVLVLIHDVTQLHTSHTQVQTLLEENQQLLREVQHRIKNNLSTISSMLHLAIGRTESEEARQALSASESQVRTVQRVHETLNVTGQYRSVDISGFLRTLCGDTQSLYSSSGNRLSFRIPDEQILFPVGTVLPLGLMVNELIANAFKHASPTEKDKATEVYVQLDRPSAEQVRVEVSDNGPGLPGGTFENTDKGLGLQIVAAQAEQIGATLSAHSEATGTRFEILLPRPRE
ncbi:MAG: sensor histidine kinase [Spirochaetales bacterium]